ncbi:hypothetical protein [Bacillus manliponensis]|uniref:hypothetical protein n=1 Tax=Bacillus manliponensis TaxID=574376 RepID=UPI0035148E2F
MNIAFNTQEEVEKFSKWVTGKSENSQALKSSIWFYEKYAFTVWKKESNKYLDMFFKISDLQHAFPEDEKSKKLVEVFT